MKKNILLAVVLLSSGLQMAAKDRNLIGMTNYRALSNIPYDSLTPKEKQDVYYMAFRSGLGKQVSAARNLLNKKFKLSNQEWTKLENTARNEGLNAVNVYFANKELSGGSKAPSQAGTVIKPVEALPKPPRKKPVVELSLLDEPKPIQQQITQITEKFEKLINEIISLQSIVDRNKLPETVADLKTQKADILASINSRNEQQLAVIEEALERSIQDLNNSINGFKKAEKYTIQKLKDLIKQTGQTYNVDIDQKFKNDVEKGGYIFALDEINKEIENQEQELAKLISPQQ